MKITVFFAFFIFSLIACQGNHPQTAKQDAGVPVVTQNKKSQVDYIIEEINIVPEEDRKKAFLKYLNHAKFVKAATAERYAAFAYNYLLNQPGDFFAVMGSADSTLISKWATIASGHIIFALKNQKDPLAYIAKAKNAHLEKAKTLSGDKKKQYEWYIEKMTKYATPHK